MPPYLAFLLCIQPGIPSSKCPRFPDIMIDYVAILIKCGGRVLLQGRIQDFLKGGGGPGADTGFFTSTPPPLDIARVTSSTFQGGGAG